MGKSTSSRANRKPLARPKKPYAGFPLTPHASGKWMKKIRGTIHYFGNWARRVGGVLVRVEGDGAKEAEAEYNAVRDDLHAGRTPRVKGDELTVAGLCNHFLTAKLRKVEAGELNSRLFLEYRELTGLCVGTFGATRLVDDLAADDFAKFRASLAKKWGPVKLSNSITRVKSVFKYGYESGLMDRPVRHGPEFVKPGKSAMRRHRATLPAKMFEAAELRAMLDGKTVAGANGPVLVRADPTLRAMILLGVNCGFGGGDCSELTQAAVDLASGWINFPRPKTGIPRRCPLWPETVAAIRAALAERPKSAASPDCGRVFLTERGTPFIAVTGLTQTDDGITGGGRKDVFAVRFRKLLVALGTKRKGVGVYALRHVFETIGGEAKDQVAVDAIMGHSDGSMAAAYRERISDERLQAVSEHVRKWLWPTDGAEVK